MHNTAQISSFILFLGYTLAILINCIFVWLALLISGLRTDFKGMFVLSAAAILPANFIPTFFGWFVGIGCMALAAMNVTNAKSWVDAAKYVAASFAITIALAFLIVYLFWDKLQAAQVSESSTKNPSVQVEPATQPGAARSERGRQNSAPSPSGAQIGAYDALKDQLTPAERAEIERQIAVP